MFCDDTLENYYRTNFDLRQHHGFSLSELDYMLPFEREIYISLLINYLQKENNKLQNQTQKNK